MRIIHEFKTFAMRGNAIDLAVGVVVGAAFTTIVNSLVKDIINPPLGLLLGGFQQQRFHRTPAVLYIAVSFQIVLELARAAQKLYVADN